MIVKSFWFVMLPFTPRFELVSKHEIFDMIVVTLLWVRCKVEGTTPDSRLSRHKFTTLIWISCALISLLGFYEPDKIRQLKS